MQPASMSYSCTSWDAQCTGAYRHTLGPWVRSDYSFAHSTQWVPAESLSPGEAWHGPGTDVQPICGQKTPITAKAGARTRGQNYRSNPKQGPRGWAHASPPVHGRALKERHLQIGNRSMGIEQTDLEQWFSTYGPSFTPSKINRSPNDPNQNIQIMSTPYNKTLLFDLAHDQFS